jgi:transposase, IS6 family
MNSKQPFKWKHFEGEIILLCVRWYLQYALSYSTLVSPKGYIEVYPFRDTFGYRFNGSQTLSRFGYEDSHPKADKRNALTRNLEEIMLERGLSVDHTTIYRWVMIYAPQIDKRSQNYLKPTNDFWRVDETYIKVKGKWKYLYRAVDSNGQTLDLMFSTRRDSQAAKESAPRQDKGILLILSLGLLSKKSVVYRVFLSV